MVVTRWCVAGGRASRAVARGGRGGPARARPGFVGDPPQPADPGAGHAPAGQAPSTTSREGAQRGMASRPEGRRRLRLKLYS